LCVPLWALVVLGRCPPLAWRRSVVSPPASLAPVRLCAWAVLRGRTGRSCARSRPLPPGASSCFAPGHARRPPLAPVGRGGLRPTAPGLFGARAAPLRPLRLPSPGARSRSPAPACPPSSRRPALRRAAPGSPFAPLAPLAFPSPARSAFARRRVFLALFCVGLFLEVRREHLPTVRQPHRLRGLHRPTPPTLPLPHLLPRLRTHRRPALHRAERSFQWTLSSLT
jgi:hypothetical protein